MKIDIDLLRRTVILNFDVGVTGVANASRVLSPSRVPVDGVGGGPRGKSRSAGSGNVSRAQT